MITRRLLRSSPKGRKQVKDVTKTSTRFLTGVQADDDYNIQGTISNLGMGVEVGQYAEVSRSFSSTEVKQFGSLVKDLNFLHESVPWSDDIEIMQESFPLSQAHISEGLVIPESQTNATMTRPLVHGIFLSSMFSSIFAGIAPGCVYINQTLQFASPVFVDETVTSRVTIEKLRRWPKGGIVVQCDTRVQKVDDETVAVTGTANVWLPKGHRKAN